MGRLYRAEIRRSKAIPLGIGKLTLLPQKGFFKMVFVDFTYSAVHDDLGDQRLRIESSNKKGRAIMTLPPMVSNLFDLSAWHDLN
jgi:hypothetical protein